jgi:hypothetical protein
VVVTMTKSRSVAIAIIHRECVANASSTKVIPIKLNGV